MPKQKIIQWTLRMPEDLMKWLRIAAAKETIRREKNVSMNKLAVEIIARAMEKDVKKGGD